jgi:2-keto-4-pentenoate hydratase/2-oxohepta-3-ene-1,7-dioic acid hydratase in catechol pathway
MKIICIGRNYAEHIAELQHERPTDPVIFMKPDSAILPAHNPFYIPDFSNDLHYEVELVVKINRLGKHIAPRFAHKYYDEIGLGIDFTARDLQNRLKDKGLPWEKAKAFDGSAVIGDFLPKTDFPDMNAIEFGLKKNQEWVQKGNSEMMLWKIDELIAYVSQFFTLKIGDFIFTGTPAGVGKVSPEDELVGFIGEKKMFEVKVK